MLTHALTSAATPTLCRSLPVFELLLTVWEDLRDDTPHFKLVLQDGIDVLTRYYKRSDDSSAYSFAQCAYFH